MKDKSSVFSSSLDVTDCWSMSRNVVFQFKSVFLCLKREVNYWLWGNISIFQSSLAHLNGAGKACVNTVETHKAQWIWEWAAIDRYVYQLWSPCMIYNTHTHIQTNPKAIPANPQHSYGGHWFFTHCWICLYVSSYLHGDNHIFAHASCAHAHAHTNACANTQVVWGRLEVSNLARGDIYKCSTESLSIYLSHAVSLSPSQSRQCQGSLFSITECITCLTCSSNYDPLLHLLSPSLWWICVFVAVTHI